MRRVVYGGTFNPPHLGHLAAARTAIDVLGLDKLLIIPAAVPPHKELPESTPAPPHRLAMAEKMADALLLPDVAEASGLELTRTGKSYTSDTLERLREQYPEAEYILSRDVRLRPEEKGEWIHSVKAREEYEIKGLRIRTLRSTDQGVAFVVEAEGKRIYHAGDLNWWHWEGEDKAWNNNMAANYKREVDRLSGQYFDAAFVPLDPRLSDACSLGLRYFLEQTDAEHVFPMHFWGDYEVCRRIRKEKDLQGMLEHVHPVEYQGQEWELC